MTANIDELKMKNKQLQLNLFCRLFIVVLLICAYPSLYANSQSVPQTPPASIDCSRLSWSDAFSQLHTKISTEYSFTTWRGIDWDVLKAKFEPIIAEAENETPKNKEKYYQALRDYMISLHDTHAAVLADKKDSVAVSFVLDEVAKHTSGSYGLIITHTSDNKYIVSYVAQGGAADIVGIKPGAEIISWNNLPIQQAAAQSPLTWSSQLLIVMTYSPATTAGINYEKLRMLLCASINEMDPSILS